MSNLTAWHAIILFVVFALLVLAVAAIVSVARRPDLTTEARLLWILIVLVAPVLGSIIWFAWGRRAGIGRPPAERDRPA
jgi:hypothetical protein